MKGRSSAIGQSLATAQPKFSAVCCCMPAKCAWVGKQKPQEEQKDWGGFWSGEGGRAPYAGYYAGWVNEDQQMKAISLLRGPWGPCSARRRVTIAFSGCGINISLYTRCSEAPFCLDISGLEAEERLMCGWGFTWNMLEVMDLSRRAAYSFPLLYTVIYRQRGCDGIVGFAG